MNPYQHQAERLNNAIVRFDFANQGNSEVAALAKDWNDWWHNARPILLTIAPLSWPALWAALEWYHHRYKNAWERAANKGAPELAPSEVEPSATGVVRSEIDRFLEAYTDAGNAAVETAKRTASQSFQTVTRTVAEAAKHVGPSPWLALGAAAGVIGAAWIFSRR
jgi:hypothetical protein